MIFQELIDIMSPDQGQIMQNIRQYDSQQMIEDMAAKKKPDIAFHNANTQIIECYTRVAKHEMHPFMVPVNQIIEFMFAKIEAEDLTHFFQMKMPFENIFIDFHGTLYEHGEHIKGVMIMREQNMLDKFEQDPDLKKKMEATMPEQLRINTSAFVIIGITKQMMEIFYQDYPWTKLDTEGNAIHITEEGLEGILKILGGIHHKSPSAIIMGSEDATLEELKYFTNEEMLQEDHIDVSTMLRKIAIGFCLYVNSVNVEIIKEEGEQTKKRRKQNKPIPQPYYWCKLETKEVHVADVEGSGTKHGYQYDVRGHFKHFKQGKMKGKILWCPPHRRGLANKVYRPKTYNLIAK